ncbi:uncharacterized protein LOC124134029 [Haliotis rufescens]|uniref:uncharacterized protein LOC124134029 n=1 Tax=Haliotis rufescens TaxID=6454 RepID=UPI001EAFFE64|nr:uncharacterized protein LOC124134029 [Haliotis rufescens]XP_046354602.1 uncharacterized protein LOC124134029 [Haliotis rufescens]XP_046354603.1 uncharacterized protein LOC124134029 [Haliotis rufescens]XP_046354604.1 uncharacterized protein LOC124134029 [Haliotis rufescens]
MEERVSVDTLLNRKARLEREKAMNAARCPKESKFGECLLNINTKDDPLLCKNLGKINLEVRRMEFKMKQLRQTFVKQSKFLNHEPLILVERPASPEVRHRRVVMDMGANDPASMTLPGYMRPLRSRCRTPSTITTIDAFTVRPKKKRNVWEEAMDEKEKPKFKSTVRPCSRLTQRELTEVHLGWSTHKTKVDKEPEARTPSPSRATPRSLPNDNQVFITQLRRTDLPRTADGRLTKSVRFKDEEIENSPPSSMGRKSRSRSAKRISFAR